MIISIASGKGGTGKTTVATNLALSIGANVQLLDADVEEPNAHLFIRPVFNKTETVYAPVPEILAERCNRCGQCGDICQFKAIVVVADTVLTFPELCHSCGGCMAVCPEDAIVESGRELGVIRQGYRGELEIIHGELRVGEAMSPPLIRRVRSFADTDKFVIIDAPPGTSCPVIAAMKDTDFVLLVTEPTPFGLYDLKLAVGAVQVLGLPAGLLVNRADIGDHEVQNYAEKIGLPILMEIPFDRRIAEAYSRGEMIVEAIPEFKEKFHILYNDIIDLLG